jgi:hypothetical protein
LHFLRRHPKRQREHTDQKPRKPSTEKADGHAAPEDEPPDFEYALQRKGCFSQCYFLSLLDLFDLLE